MSEFASIKNPKEETLVRYVDRFALTLSLTKICARSCGVFRGENPSSQLSQDETNCLVACGKNIEKTFDNFTNKVRDSLGGSE